MVRKISRLSAVGLFGLCALLSSGCSLNSLGSNIWAGFGYGVGGIPAQVVGQLIVTPLLNSLFGTGNTTT